MPDIGAVDSWALRLGLNYTSFPCSPACRRQVVGLLSLYGM